MKFFHLFLASFVFDGMVSVLAVDNPFAVLRLGHESIRGAILDCNEAVAEKDLAKLVGKFTDLVAAVEIHAQLEEDGFFPFFTGMADYFFETCDKEDCEKGACKEENCVNEVFQFVERNIGQCYDIHGKDFKIVVNVEGRLEPCEYDGEASCNEANAIRKFESWAEYHDEDHLKFEEASLMPLTPIFNDRYGDDNTAVFHCNILKDVYDDVGPTKFAWFAGWNVKYLLQYGSPGLPSTSPAKGVEANAFSKALQAICTPSMWEIIEPHIEQAYNDAEKSPPPFLNGDGKIADDINCDDFRG